MAAPLENESFDDVISSHVDAFADPDGILAQEEQTPSPETVEVEEVQSAEIDGVQQELSLEDPDDTAEIARVAASAEVEPAAEPEAEPELVDPRDTQIAQLLEDNKLNQERIDRLIAGVAPAAAAAAAPAAVAPPEPEPLGEMPDPIVDAEGYADWNAKRTEQMIAAHDQSIAQREYINDANKVQDRLWNGFIEAHAEWEGVPTLVGNAAEAATADLGESYTEQQLFDATHAKMLELRAQLAAPVAASTLVEPTPKVTSAPGTKTPPKRTAGMSVEGRAPAPKKKAADEQPAADMVDQMYTLQQEMGLVELSD